MRRKIKTIFFVVFWAVFWCVQGFDFVQAGNNGGKEWSRIPNAEDEGIRFGVVVNSVTYGNGLFVAVGPSGKASYSSDGINWTSLPAGTDTGIKFGTTAAYSVTYGNGLFVAVGESGKASYSSDGINWTSLPAGTDTGIKFGTTYTVNSVTYGNGLFVAVGYSGKASYSSDGINWTSLPAGTDTGIKFGTIAVNSVTYGNGLFVAVGDSGKASYSSDGINWTSLSAGTTTGIKFDTTTVRSVTYGNGLFVAVGYSGKASYSSDGINWTSLSAGTDTGIKFGTNAVRSVTYGNGLFMAVGNSGMASYSSDGIDWTSLPAGTTTGIKFGINIAYSVAYGNGLFVAVGNFGMASYSSDGINWTSLPAGTDTGIKFGAYTVRSVTYGNGLFMAVGNSGKASYSSDGINWTSLPAGTDTGIKFGTTYTVNSVTYGNGLFMAVGNSGKASYSSDGINWTSLSAGTDTGIKFDTTAAYSVTYGNGLFMAVGNSGMASYSSDGINWTSLPAGTDTGIKFGAYTVRSVTYGNGLFVAVGDSGKASYSSDGINWTSLSAGTDTGIKFGTTAAYSVTYGNGLFVAVGSSGKASYSSDGINWTSLSAGTDTGIKFGTNIAYSITYDNGLFVAVGESGKASYSSDGINWTSLSAGTDTGIKFGTTIAYSVTYGNGLFMAVGNSGKASYSGDTSNPTASSFSPADNATGVGLNDNLVLTFDETVNVGTGNIVIKKTSDNSVVETIAVTSGQVTGTGTNTITVNSSVTLEANTGYYIQIDATAFDDTVGNSFAGISDSSTWNFTSLDTVAPTLFSISSDKTNGVYKAGEIIDIDVAFSEAVTSTGNVTVTLETGDTDRTCTFNLTNTTTGTCNYTVEAGDTTSDLDATISGTIKDQANNPLTNFTPATSLATNKNIVIDTTSPSGGSIGYSNGFTNTTPISLVVGDGTDSGSGINSSSRIIQRKTATLSDGTCGSYGSFSTIAPSGTYPNFTDTTVISGNCYQYKYLVSDNAGNQGEYVSSNEIKFDTTNPTVSAGSDQNKNSQFTQDATTSDASGIASYTWSKQSGSGTITFGSSTSEDTTITASENGTYVIRLTVSDNAGNSNYDEFTLVWDASAPTLSFTDEVATGPGQSDTITASWGDATTKKWDYDTDGTCSTDPADYTKTNLDSINQNTETNNGKYICLYGEDDLNNKATLASTNTINIDITSPTISSISSDKTNGAYKAGETIDIDVTFSEAVTSTGSVTVTLETGDTDRTCTFNLTNTTTGTCNYTVEAGDTTSDLDATISGTIKDQANNTLTNFTPATSLATNKNIIIDTTNPTVSAGSDQNKNSQFTQDATVSDSSGIASYTWTKQSGSGTITFGSSTSEDTTITASENGTYVIRLTVSDNAGNSNYDEFTLVWGSDTLTLGEVSSSPGSTSATISWTTSKEASSQVEYGLTHTYGNSTQEADTSPRVTTHTATLNNLVSCARYFYVVKSKDSSNNQVTSSRKDFNTSGCTTSEIIGGTSSSVNKTTGGEVTLTQEDGNTSLYFPPNYSEEDADVQINELDTGNLPDSPEGRNLVEQKFFKFIAVGKSGQILASFSKPVTLTISYSEEAEKFFDENTLGVFKYLNGQWEEKECTLDSSKNTITCVLNNFSTYALFGEEKTDNPIIAIGEKQTISFSQNESAPLKKRAFYFRGYLKDYSQNDKVEIYKDNKLIATEKLSKEKKWRKKIKQKANTVSSYHFRYVKKGTNEELSVTPTYNLLIDKIRPRFTFFRKSALRNRGDVIIWKAADNDKIKYYTIKFQGKTYNLKEPRFTIPQSARRGISATIVRAFDRAENSVTKKMIIKVR